MTDDADLQREICRAFDVTPKEIGLGAVPTPELVESHTTTEQATCLCGDTDPEGCMYLAAGYPWCRPCGEHHRAPECAVDSGGRALASCGCAWDDVLNGGLGHTCDYGDDQ